MEQGLAATVTNRYGNGEGNTVKHFYAGKGKKNRAWVTKTRNPH